MIQTEYLLTFGRQEQVLPILRVSTIVTFLTYLYLGLIPGYFGTPYILVDIGLFDDTAYFLLSLPDLSEFGFYLGPL